MVKFLKLISNNKAEYHSYALKKNWQNKKSVNEHIRNELGDSQYSIPQ